LGTLLLGLLASATSGRWWSRLWPPEERSEYAQSAGYWAAASVRAAVFVLLFAPVAALPALVAGAVLKGRAGVSLGVRAWRRWRTPRPPQRAGE
jgi:hypothetical protein